MKCFKCVQKPCKPVSNFSYHRCVWGQNRILCIPKNVIKENTNKVFKSVQKPCKPVSNFSYHGSVWGLNRIHRIPKNVIKENTNKMFKKCQKTMQTHVKLLIP